VAGIGYVKEVSRHKALAIFAGVLLYQPDGKERQTQCRQCGKQQRLRRRGKQMRNTVEAYQ